MMIMEKENTITTAENVDDLPEFDLPASTNDLTGAFDALFEKMDAMVASMKNYYNWWFNLPWHKRMYFRIKWRIEDIYEKLH